MSKKPAICSCCEYYRWRQFERDAEKIAARIAPHNFKNIFGPARGGLALAVKLSHLLDIPFAEKPSGPNDTLIVDDIADTGKTLLPFSRNGYTIITLFYHKKCSYKPWLWLREKKEKYIIFPWEKQECVKTPRL
ncbi:phosphoribosyltransferase [Patescibacteria group bacterium]|nr:phosphoribosyltransferase [Patescibacteria group bacterium]